MKASQNRLPRQIEPPNALLILSALTALLAFIVLGPAMSAMGGDLSYEGNPYRQGAYIFIALVVAVALKPHQQPRRLLAIPMPLGIALAICWISIVWAIAPDVSLRRLVLTSVIIWMICASVKYLKYENTLNFLRIALLLALVANFAAVLFFPSLGIHQADERGDYSLLGDWRGIVMGKNFAGALCAMTILYFLFDSRTLPRVLRWGTIAAAAVFLYYSQSRTSMGMVIGAAVVGLVYLRVSARFRGALIAIVFTLALGLAVLWNVYNDPLARLLQDPTTLTGRWHIWSTLFEFIEDNPLLGSGFGSFWNIGPNSPIFKYDAGWITTIASGHNGFIELAVQLGIPLAIVVIGLLVIWPMVRLLNDRLNPAAGALQAATLVFCVGHNMTETDFLDRDTIMEVFLIFSIALIWKVSDLGWQDNAPPMGRRESGRDDADRIVRPRETFHAGLFADPPAPPSSSSSSGRRRREH